MNDKRRVKDVLTRYVLILAAAIPDLFIFYLIFEPLTIYPVYWILGIFADVSVNGNVLLTNGVPVKFIKACIAGSAYYFLFFLNLSTPEIKTRKRIKILLLSFLTLLAFNVARIIVLMWFYFREFAFFDVTHWFLWHFTGTLLVVGMWFFQVRYFKIKEIPVYSDVKFLIGKTRKERKPTIYSRKKKLQACIFP